MDDAMMMDCPAEVPASVGVTCLFCKSNKSCMTLAEAGRSFDSAEICKAINCRGVEKILKNSFFCPVCINDLKILLDLVITLEQIQSQIQTLRTHYENKLQNSLNLDLANDISSKEKQNREQLLECIKKRVGRSDGTVGNEDQLQSENEAQAKTGEFVVHENNVISVTAILRAAGDDSSESSDNSSDDSEDSSTESGDSSSEVDDTDDEIQGNNNNSSKKLVGLDESVKRKRTNDDEENLKAKYKLRDVSVVVKRCEREESCEAPSKKKFRQKSSLFPCLIAGCRKKYPKKEARDSHITGFHLELCAYKCSSCPDSFKNPRSLKQHMKIHHKAQFVCRECGKECRTSISLSRHRAKHESQLRTNGTNKSIICEHKDCGLSFKDKISYYVHVRRDHLEMDKPHECRICRLKFRTEPELEEHVTVHNDATPRQCNLCDRQFATQLMLEKHVKHYHEDEKIECIFCYRLFTDKHEFKDHLLSHASERQHVCEFCGLACLREGALRDHILQTHPEANMEFPTCKICNKTFKTEKFLQDHIRLHTGEFRYLCDKCSYGSMQKSHLVKHMDIHNTEYNYECEVCSKKFTTKDNLRSHRRSVHDLSKPFPCPICFRRFICEGTLQKHSHQHHGTKKRDPIPCKFCKKTFMYETTLQKHMTAAHGIPDFSASNSAAVIQVPLPLIVAEPTQEDQTMR